MHNLSNAMYGCPTKLSDNMAVDDFRPALNPLYYIMPKLIAQSS